MTAIATHLGQATCYKCDRPPLTFDHQDRALCARHATIFLVAGRIDLVDSPAPEADPVAAKP